MKNKPSRAPFFPGYLSAGRDGVMDDDTWHLVKNTPEGDQLRRGANKNRPAPDLEDRTVSMIVNQVRKAGEAAPQGAVRVRANACASIWNGPSPTSTATSRTSTTTKTAPRCAVSGTVGRSTPVELDFSRSKKVSEPGVWSPTRGRGAFRHGRAPR